MRTRLNQAIAAIEAGDTDKALTALRDMAWVYVSNDDVKEA